MKENYKLWHWKRFLQSFSPLPLSLTPAKRISSHKDIFTSPHIERNPFMSLSAEGNTLLAVGRITTEKGMQASLDAVKDYTF